MSVTIAAESRVRVLGESRVQISDGERVRVYAGDTVYINESTGGGDLERAVRTVTVAATADPADGVIVLAGSGGFALTLPTTGFDDGQAVEVWGAASTDCTVESAADLFPIEGGATVADIPVAANQVLRFKFYTTVDDEPAWRCIYDSTAAGGESNPVDVIVAFMDDYALALVPALGYFGLSAGARVLIATGDDRGLWTWNGTELVDLVDLWDGTHAGTELWLESVHRGPATGSVIRFGERWTMGLNLQGQPTLRYDGQIDRRVDEHTGHPDAHRLVVGETVTILDHAARNAVWESGLGPDGTMGVFEWEGNVYTASDPSTDTDVMICEVTAAEYVQDSGVAVVAHDIAGTPTLVPITGVPEGQSAPLGDVYHDVANGQVIGFTHSGDGAGRSCVGIVRTDDPLVEWSWCGLAVTPNITAGWTQNTIGSFVPYVVVDFDGTDYFVLYHKDQLAGGTVILLAASRAPVADVCTAALTSTVSTWEKWTGTDWSEPGIEGAPADIAPDGWIHTHANAFYDATSNEVVLIGTSNGDTLRAVRSSDAVTFGTPVQIENRHNGFVDRYATFYSGEPSRPKELRAGDSPVLWTVRMIGGQSQWSDPTIIIEQKLVGWGHLGGGGGAGTGDVVGPASATDGAPVLFDGTTGKLVKAGATNTANGLVKLDGSGTIPDSLHPASIARDTEITSAISDHAGATDPHGDRAYAAGLVDDLSGVTDAATARTNLGLGTAATVATTDLVTKALFDANTILAANSDDTPAAVTVAEQRIVGRVTGGNITALTAAQVLSLLGVGWVTVSDTTVSNSGSGVASISVSCSGYRKLRVWFRGRSLKSTTTTDTLNMTFNSDTGSVYSRNNTAAGTAFVISSSFTASNTNTNRQGSFDLDIDCGQSSYTTFRLRHTSPSSTATTAGSTDWPNGLYLATTAISSIQFAFAGGNIADDSCLVVEGLA